MTIAAAVAARGALRRGAVGDDVRALQGALAAAGHELVADGVFGVVTQEAVRRFQAAHRLAIDGVVGRQTAAALDAGETRAAAPALRSAIVDAPWLSVARALTGAKEIPGALSNPLILSWRDAIVEAFPDLAPNVRWYVNDDTPWCGLFAAYCLVRGGPFKPPLAPLLVANWRDGWRDGVRLAEPSPGAIMIKPRAGGNHIYFYEAEDAEFYFGRGGNQSNSVNVARFRKSGRHDVFWPAAGPLPTTGRVFKTFADAVAGSEA